MALKHTREEPPVIIQGPFPIATRHTTELIEAEPEADRILIQNELIRVYTIEPGWFGGRVVHAKPNMRTVIFYPGGKKKELRNGPHWVGAFMLHRLGRLMKGTRSPVMVVEVDERQRLYPVQVTARTFDNVPVSLNFSIHYSVDIKSYNQILKLHRVLKVRHPITDLLSTYAIEAGIFILRNHRSRGLLAPYAHNTVRYLLYRRLHKYAEKAGLKIWNILILKVQRR